VRRVIRMQPNAATVSYSLIPDGDELIRATSPEARIHLDGKEYKIGGLSGQSIGNYLKDPWIQELKADAGSYVFSKWSEGPIEPRFGWKKRPEWLSRHANWPAPGRHVMMTYTPPNITAALSATTLGPAILTDDFLDGLKPAWKTRVSQSHPRSSFVNEGKAGEIYTPAETSVYAEQAWPANGNAIEVIVDAGDDAKSNSWGPGFVLMSAGVVALEFNIRPNEQTYTVNGKVYGKFDRTKPQRLRARLADGTWVCEAATERGEFTEIAKVPAAQKPTHFRVGKCGRDGKGDDLPNHDVNQLVRSKISGISVHAESPQAAAPATTALALPEVVVHYNIYDGIPLIEKWLTIKNNTAKAVRINKTIVEELRYAEEESQVEEVSSWLDSRLYVETDFTFCSQSAVAANRFGVLRKPDPSYKSQVSYALKTPCLLEVAPESGPAIDLESGKEFTSIRSFELLKDTMERERSGLAQRRFYRAAAPWVQENPIMAHLISADPDKIKAMIDQAAEVGFEMVILSFGSGLNMENRDAAYQAKYKALADYAASKGLVLGSYSVLASRGADKPENNCGGPGSRAHFGKAPCLGSEYGIKYLQQISDFLKNTGFNVFENDGSYAADTCARTNHPGHRELADSQWRQWEGITNLYKDLRGRGIYLNVPDWYFLNGSSKICMGYREVNWSLPRAEQEIIERQNIYDGTWEKAPSMGWMFVPLTQYHGGGAAATIEPLKDNLPHYEARMANLFGAGVQACYRGPRLYDSDETRDLVKKWVSFYKAHREVLDSDLIHLRRPDGRNWDGWLHVNPQGKEKAMAFIYNPLEVDIEREIRLPLYYAGVKGKVKVSVNSGIPTKMEVSDDRSITMKVKIAARSRTWVLVE
jgi:hypothetical protein